MTAMDGSTAPSPQPSRDRWVCVRCGRPGRTRGYWGDDAAERVLLVRRGRFDGHCSDCAGELRDADARAQIAERRLAARRDRVCPVCGQPFTPPRQDGRYCTPACRQKAYRARKHQ